VEGWLYYGFFLGFFLAGENGFTVGVKHRDNTVAIRSDCQRPRQVTGWIDQSKVTGFNSLRGRNLSLSMDRGSREDILFNEPAN